MGEDIGRQLYAHADIDPVGFGMDAQMCIRDRPEGIEPYYTLYNYDRSIPMAFGIAVLILAIVLIAKGKGVKAILGLAYSLYLVVCVLLPMVFSGYSPIAVSILCAILSVTVTLLLLNGQSKKTYAAIVSTVAGVIVSLIFFLILSNMMHLDGFSAEESEGLIPVSYTHLDVYKRQG